MKSKMFKTTLSMIGLIVLSMTVTGWAQLPEHGVMGEQNFISSENMRYTVYCPSSWKAEIVLENPTSSPYVIREGIQVFTENEEVVMIEAFCNVTEKTVGKWIKNNPYLNPEPVDIQLTRVSNDKLPAVLHFQAGGSGVPDVLRLYFLKDSKAYRFSYWQKYGGHNIDDFWTIVNSFTGQASPEYFVKENSSFAVPSPAPEMVEGTVSSLYGDSSCGDEVEYIWGSSYCWWCSSNPYDCCPNDGNCTWYAFLALCGSNGVRPTWCANPSSWANEAEMAGWQVRDTPRVASVGANSGHVAYVRYVYTNSIAISEQSCGDYEGDTHYRTTTASEFSDYISKN